MSKTLYIIEEFFMSADYRELSRPVTKGYTKNNTKLHWLLIKIDYQKCWEFEYY